MPSISVRMTADVSEMTRAFGQAEQSANTFASAIDTQSQQVSRASKVSGRSLSAVGTSARFAAVGLANELSPALGKGVSQLSSLASVAAVSGTALGALATVGIGAIVLALSTFITKARQAEKVQRELTQAFEMGNVPRIQKELNDLREKERTILAASFDLQATGFENTEGLREDALAAIRNEIELRERQIQRINQANIEGARSVENLKEQEKETRRLAEAAGQWAQAMGDVITKQEALRELAPFLLREEADTIALTEAQLELGEVAQRVAQQQAESLRNLEEQASSIAEVQAEAAIAVESKWKGTWQSIGASFSSTIAGIVQGTATLADFFASALNTMIQAVVNFVLQWVTQLAFATAFKQTQDTAQVAVHTATESAKTAVTAAGETARLGIVLATNTAMIGAAGATLAAIGATGSAAMAVMGAVVAATSAVLAAIGAALAATIVGAPLAPAYFAAAAAVGAAGTAAVAAGTAAIAAAVAGASAVIAGALALKEGGIVTGPTLALIGEAGPEAVIPLNRTGTGGIRGGDIHVDVLLDERTLLKALVPNIPGFVRIRAGIRTI